MLISNHGIKNDWRQKLENNFRCAVATLCHMIVVLGSLELSYPPAMWIHNIFPSCGWVLTIRRLGWQIQQNAKVDRL